MIQFFAVVENGKTFTFSKWHHLYIDAVEEAKRLAQKEHKKFLVLKMLGSAEEQTAPVKYTEED